MNKKLLGTLVLPLLVVLSTVFILDRLFAYSVDTYREAEVISEIRDKIRLYYVDDIPPEKIFHGALEGMVAVLDPHSEYLDEDNYKQLFEGTEGEFIGIGIELAQENGILTVISPIEGSPAAKSGVLAGDKIVAIDGQSTEGVSLSEAVHRLRGKKGSKVILTVIHEGSKTSTEVEIERDRIQIQSTKDAAIIDRAAGIGYVRIVKFNRHTGDDLRKNIADLLQGGMRSLVIDLRFNPGGLLDAAVAVVDTFVSDGVVVYTKGRNPDSHKVYRAADDNGYDKLPLVVLVNKRSASASEIVAGALQDYHRAVIVGSRTYGKGSVQSVIQLKDEKSALKLTTAKYYTPSGRSIEKGQDALGGIQPDVQVDLTLEEERELVNWLYGTAHQKGVVADGDKQLHKALAVLKEQAIIYNIK
jgi:carboxyl-terminal processing protease